MPNVSILSVLRDRASTTPDDVAFTFTDYDRDWDGVAESLTWSQLYRRTLNVAQEISQQGAPGDRALIIAPQGLAYIVAFLGAMQAGFIAVPLSVPVPGSHDERVSAVVTDTSPTVVLTTSAVFEVAAQYVDDGAAVIATIAVDTLDLDAPAADAADLHDGPEVAYLQYTSGSTRLPAGVMISHRNLVANFEQLMAEYLAHHGGKFPPDTSLVSWLPFYHDMGLMLGIAAPILSGNHADLMSPIAFLSRPARWLQMMARSDTSWSGAPNFAFDLTARRATDDELDGLDLSRVIGIINGAERIHPDTLVRFNERLAPNGFRPEMVAPSYGLAEATVYVASGGAARVPEVVEFDADELTLGNAIRKPGGTQLLRYQLPVSPLVRIVDADSCQICPDGTVGEIWTHGENVSAGYWRKPEQTGSAFGATLARPAGDVPPTGWLRTGDQGFVSEGDLFIVGRIKDMLIVRGRNHYSDDIEATVQKITGGRVAAIAVSDEETEKLVTVVELKVRDDTDLESVKSDVVAAISRAHGLQVADIVLVEPGSMPTTTSGKIRRAACIEQYRQGQFVRLDA
ncbi:AMP-binding protein [Mycolicibacterium rhodesiae]|uniref:Acyl-CoA synthetase n=1 Tax=Mycolicibacterium rhodesiae TaxID=36814 RepID=A0A1X0J1K5_MYCRH|nr:AMP-binding protein [Mycolicibacterium rhodesiae]MCV7344822.1 AMP-binding protein [Mycolicibacterium rhodesiae]ORB55721.1 acyl-CoA synthetase [Mycolicibacterium rhodesiae]